MIGIEIEHESSYENILYDFLKGINFDDYKIDITEEEIYAENNFDNIHFNLYDFQNEISSKTNYYIIFLNLKLYNKKGKIKAINTYEDFLNSDCQMIILISDNSLIEIYFKEDNLKKIILNNLAEKNISYEIKTKGNDSRLLMSVI